MTDQKDKAPTMVNAINRALHEAMDNDDAVMVIGEDVGTNGGVFRVTEGLLERFGAERAIDAPLAESGIIGFSIGMAMNGFKPVAEMQFSGFSYYALAQIENHAARMRWRTRGSHSVPMVIRMPYGAGVRALEHHSESREAFFGHMPGLKTVIPATPARAYALTLAAIRDPDPVIVMEPKAVYRAIREDIDETEAAEIGVSRIVREGKDLTIVSYGAMLHRTIEAAETLASDGIDVEIIDIETIAPLDADRIAASVEKTGRLLVVNEAPPSFGPASEIAMRVTEEAFYSLRHPIRRLCGWDIHVPFFSREQAYLPSVDRIVRTAQDMITD